MVTGHHWTGQHGRVHSVDRVPLRGYLEGEGCQFVEEVVTCSIVSILRSE